MEKAEKEKYTKYEIARILGARALQIAMNAPLLLALPKEKLEELNYDPLKIAEIEFNSNVLPITVKRPLPQKEEIAEEKEEEIEIIAEEEKPEEKPEAVEEKEEKEKEEEIAEAEPIEAETE